MRKKILLSSLTVGRCFQVVVDDKDDGTASSEGVVRAGMSLLSPASAWRIVRAGDDVAAQNAAGEDKTFPSSTVVVEIPRQGYDRLVERANEA